MIINVVLNGITTAIARSFAYWGALDSGIDYKAFLLKS